MQWADKDDLVAGKMRTDGRYFLNLLSITSAVFNSYVGTLNTISVCQIGMKKTPDSYRAFLFFKLPSLGSILYLCLFFNLLVNVCLVPLHILTINAISTNINKNTNKNWNTVFSRSNILLLSVKCDLNLTNSGHTKGWKTWVLVVQLAVKCFIFIEDFPSLLLQKNHT